jgi:hypothetical protein
LSGWQRAVPMTADEAVPETITNAELLPHLFGWQAIVTA